MKTRKYKVREHLAHQHLRKVYKHVFEEEAPSIDIHVRTRFYGGDPWAFCSQYKSGRISITLLNEYPSRQMYEELLTHEIVHVWQYKNKTRDHHGKTFWQWDQKVREKFGYGLKKAYDENDYQ